MVRIVHRDLVPCYHPPRDDDDALHPAPVEPLELAIRPARVIDEPGEIAHLPLVDLVASTPGAAEHDVYAFDAVRDEADEFADGGAAVEVLLFVISDLSVLYETHLLPKKVNG